MTTVGALLFALDGRPISRIDGLALPALVAPAGPSSVEVVFRTRAPLDRQKWLSIVVHHSGAMSGTPASLEAQARAMNLHGLGYHFVIGNGHGIGDGELHVGYRWLDQLPGAHVAGTGRDADWHNLHSIGICLIGNGDRQEFTPAQLRRLSQLVDALARELKIPRERIALHSEIAPVSSPGLLFPTASFREQLPATK
jgi:N-acetyl-anhydromuramyl-L-alanine amidase AmpD